MKYVQSLLILLISFTLLGAQEREITPDLIFKGGLVEYASLGNWQWIPKEDAYAFFHYDSVQQGYALYRVDLASWDTTLFLPAEELAIGEEKISPSGFSFAPNGSKLLLWTRVHRLWRRSRAATYYVYDFAAKQLFPLVDPAKRIRNVTFAPNGEWVAYIHEDHNLYAQNLRSRREYRLTRDGSEVILNGHFGWVYEEEFGRDQAYEWSPDSRYIAFWRVDQSQVKKYPLIRNKTPYPEVEYVRYPKVGETNPTMHIGVIRVPGGRTKWLKLGPEKDQYYPRLYWLPESPSRYLILERLNRRQNRLDLLLANRINGKTEVVFTETDTCWVDVRDDFQFLDENTFLWSSERSGYRHLYRVDLSGQIVDTLTSGEWEVSQVIKVDKENQQIFFSGKKAAFIENQVYRVSFTGAGLKQLTDGEGWHSVYLSPSGGYFIDRYSNTQTPPRISLRSADGSLIRVLGESKLKEPETYGYTYPTFLRIPTSDGVELEARMTLPHEFDAKKKYPVIIRIYGMPGAPIVADYWGGSGFLWDQMLAQKGFILLQVDPRQTGKGGKRMKNLAYGDIGKWLIRDLGETVRHLQTLSYVDSGRIGIWGWSGGGYSTALALTKGSAWFKVGVAVAPVTDFRFYDTIYTERYMGLLPENAAGYDSTSVLSYIDRFQGKLLLIHGIADDNVHVQNTEEFLEACIRANKYVDVMFYPNRNHGIYGGNATRHVFTLIADYFLNNL